MSLQRLIESATRRTLGAMIAAVTIALPAAGQTDYYNTDIGRPLRIEDAHPVERRAIEIQAAPVRIERLVGGIYHWSIEPELAFGILPRTQLEFSLPFASIDAVSVGSTSGLAGVRLSVLHNLNAETALPALAISGNVLFASGSLAPDRNYASAKGIMTRTFPWARVHVNGEYTFGSRLPASGAVGHSHGLDDGAELSRWMVGAAIDRAFPLTALLLSGEVYATEPMRLGERTGWNAGAGLRYQLAPRLAIDGGFGRRFRGEHRAWYATFGTAYSLGMPWRR